jgi:two-component system OmpR family response regulator
MFIVSSEANELIQYKNLLIDSKAHRVFLGRDEIKFSKKEFLLLSFLILNKGIVLSKSQIFDVVWGYCETQMTTNTVEVHIASLRRKLEKQQNKKFIHTIHGIGYVLR